MLLQGLSRVKSGARAGERGVVLILTLFVILITYALVTQLTLSSSVAYQATRNSADRIRMEAACLSAAREILDLISNDASEGGTGGLTSSGPNVPGSGDQGSEPGSGAPSGEGFGDSGDDGSNSDSWEDSWARPMRITMSDMEITTFVQDENGKFNILTLVAEDEEFRELSRERCVRILDFMREDFEGDLDSFDARQITDEIVEWLEGRTRSDEYPRPYKHSNPEEGETTLLFALEELMVLESVTEDIFYDQFHGDEFIAPGLESVFTVLTSIALDPPGSDDDEPGAPTGESPAAGPAGGDQGGGETLGGDDVNVGGMSGAQDSGQSGSDRIEGADGDEGGSGAALTLNLNTAPKAVLRGWMATDKVPSVVIDEILEHRNEVDEEALAKQQKDEVDNWELEQALYGSREREPKKYFKSMDDLSEIESIERNLSPEARQEFMESVTVQSEVFTVYLYARIPPDDWIQEERYGEPSGPVLRLKTVIWRRGGNDRDGLLTLVPWHEVPYTRWRIPDFQDELEPFVPPDF